MSGSWVLPDCMILLAAVIAHVAIGSCGAALYQARRRRFPQPQNGRKTRQQDQIRGRHDADAGSLDVHVVICSTKVSDLFSFSQQQQKTTETILIC